MCRCHRFGLRACAPGKKLVLNVPRIAFLVHGGSTSVEAFRSRGLTRCYPQDRVRFLYRSGDRRTAALAWNAEIQSWRPDLLYIVNTALPGALLAPWWRWRHSLPYILDTGDAVYEMARSSGGYSPWTLPFLRVAETVAQRNAHAVVVRGTEHQRLLHRSGLKRVLVIRDGFVEHPDLSPAVLSALRARLGLTGKFVVGILGSLVFSPRLGICYGWDLVQALQYLRDLPVQGLIIGDGPGRSWLEAHARAHGVIDRLTFAGRIPYEDVPLYLQLIDVALSTQTNNLAGRVRTTGKLPEYMAAGRFILASRVGEAAILLPEDMLLDYQGEVDPSYPSSLAREIRRLHSDPMRTEAGRALLSVATDKCSYDVLARQFAEVIGTVD